MSKTIKAEIKCDKCAKWTDGNKMFCNHCGGILEEERVKAAAAREKDKFTLILIDIHPDDPFLIKIGKRIIQVAQIIYMTFLSFMLWLISMVAG